MREALARHAQCWEEDEVDPSVAAAGVKKALVPRSEVTAVDGVEATWSFLEEYFAFNASIEGVFRHSRGRFSSGAGTYHHGGVGGGVTYTSRNSRLMSRLPST